jgi:hypothetical protein
MRERIRMRGDVTRFACHVGHAAFMFARDSSTRGQMKSPSIAQRGEGGVRGGSGESFLLTRADNRRSVMQGICYIFSSYSRP